MIIGKKWHLSSWHWSQLCRVCYISSKTYTLWERYKAGRVFTLGANCLAALKLFGKIVIGLRYNSGDIFTNCIATFPIVAHLSTALQNKSHKSFMSAAVPKVLVTNRNNVRALKRLPKKKRNINSLNFCHVFCHFMLNIRQSCLKRFYYLRH